MIIGGESAGVRTCAPAVSLRAARRVAGTEGPSGTRKGGSPPRGVEGWPVTEIGERLGGGYEHKMPWKLANLVYGIYDEPGRFVGCRLWGEAARRNREGRAVVRGLLLPR